MSEGRNYWRSLEELAETPGFLSHIEETSPRFAAAARHAVDRRRFLQLMAASMALGGLSGCGPEPAPRQLLPYVEQPPGIVPGRERFYATATTLEGYATGVLLGHQMARPVKVDGNPDHPASRGASSAIMQATLLDLYDPHRAQLITGAGQIRTWPGFVAAMLERRASLFKKHGEGLRLLTGTTTSPFIEAQVAALRQHFPALRWHRWEPLHRDVEHEASRRAFGRPLDTVYDLTKAETIFAVESDLISEAPGHLAYARDFATLRRPAEKGGRMSRVYAVESTPTLIGAKADHRLALGPDEIAQAMRHLAAALGAGPEDWARHDTAHASWLAAAAQDLKEKKGRALVHAGREQPLEIHLLAHAINGALGAHGATARLIEPVAATGEDTLAALVKDMAAGQVDTLFILGTNPAFTAPADLGFTAALHKVPVSVYWGAYADETALAATWHVPAAHEYESWGDARAFDGTVTIQQPQVRPLYNGYSAHQLLAVLAGETEPDDLAALRAFWQQQHKQQHHKKQGGDFDAFWHDALRLGVVAGSAAEPVTAQPHGNILADLPALQGKVTGVTLLFRADPALRDGRFADNPWLLELPRPFTRLTWDNAALIAPETARRLKLRTEDVVMVTANGKSLRAPVFVLPGQAADCVTLPLGFGRRAGGALAAGPGFDPYPLRVAATPWAAPGTIRPTSDTWRLATIQGHDRIAGRDLVREGKLEDFRHNPDFLKHHEKEESLYPGFSYPGNAWAMAIDLGACIGCQACVTACQAENNVPIVGKDQVLDGRIMQWLRVDRYYSGSPDAPSIAFEPVPCMQCENAPCEVVCPVHATVHDHEGLNAMVYNRCIGTRFCSNNCPYKVRRFNFFGYAEEEKRAPDSWNPEVTVRGRGVMEKCTYCVQRIRAAQIDADRESRPIREGEIVTACQQACPTQAIVFGDKNDPKSAVSKRKASPLDYTLLAELNTRPRTSYAAIIRNPNPKIGEGEA